MGVQGDWFMYELPFQTAGRYSIKLSAQSEKGAILWLEDYVDNTDGRTYNVSGDMKILSSTGIISTRIDGSPFNAGIHKMKIQPNPTGRESIRCSRIR